MKSDIISKLKKTLKASISNEPQVIYILTRIGKILELEKSKSKYPVLNFYRNWSVHSEIDHTEPVVNILKEFIVKKEKRHLFSRHTRLCKELNTFLENHDLPHLKKSKLNNFIFYLGKVISDTPVKIRIDTQYTISIDEPINKDWSGLYTISPLLYSPEGRENRARKK